MAAQSVLQDRIGRRVPLLAKERLRDVGVRLGRAAGAVQERAVIAARTRLVALRDQDLALENLEIEVVREAARGLGEHAPGLIGLSPKQCECPRAPLGAAGVQCASAHRRKEDCCGERGHA